MNKYEQLVAEWEWVIWMMSWGHPAQVTIRQAVLADERLTKQQRVVFLDLVDLIRGAS